MHITQFSFQMCHEELIQIWLYISLLSVSWGHKISYKLVEENHPGVILGNLNHYIINTLHYSPTQITFHLNSIFFEIDSKSKNVVVKKPIDVDSLCTKYSECCSESKCVISTEIVVQKNRVYQTKILMSVHVQDIDDNSPTFLEPTQVLSLSENIPINQSVTIDGAVDKDHSKINRIKIYNFFDTTNTFYLVYNELDPEMLQLVLKKPLDYESRIKYDCSMKVCDKTGKTCASKQIIINVVDQNDNDPIFDRKVYQVIVKEDHKLKKPFLRVHATDRDSYLYNKTLYGIQGSYDDKSTFKINTDTGEISLLKKLIFKNKSSYKFNVFAIDSKSITHKKDYSEVMVTVEDVNNNYPEIALLTGPMPDKYVVKWKENENPANLFSIKVTDKDSKENGKVNCSIKKLENDGVNMMIVDKSIYQIFTTRRFDYEKEDLVKLKLICTDNGTPVLTSIKSIIIQLEDVNEYNPIFQEKQRVEIQLPENIEPNRKVLSLTADDKDKGAKLVYQLNKEAQPYFQINHKTGYILTGNTMLDREQLDSIRFIVSVTDAEVDPRTATVNVNVRILDKNDNVPKFVHYNKFEVQENQFLYTKLTNKVHAEDDDKEAPNNVTVFQLLHTYNAQLHSVHERIFDVTWKGEIETLAILDREKSENYTLTVLVHDQGSPSLSASTNITVTVLDLNDNWPVWILPEQYQSHTQIELNVTMTVKVGSVLFELKAFDTDLNDAGRVSYEFPPDISFETKMMDYLRINSSTGKLYVAVSPIPRGSHKVRVRARDHGEPHLFTDMVLLINVMQPTESIVTGLNAAIIITMLSMTAVVATFLIVAIIFIRKSPTIPKSLQASSIDNNSNNNDRNQSSNVLSGAHYRNVDSQSVTYADNSYIFGDNGKATISNPSLEKIDKDMTLMCTDKEKTSKELYFNNTPDITTLFMTSPNTAVEDSFQTYVRFATKPNSFQLSRDGDINICQSTRQMAPQLNDTGSIPLPPPFSSPATGDSGDDSGKGASDLDPVTSSLATVGSHYPYSTQQPPPSYYYSNTNPVGLCDLPPTATLYGNIQIIPSFNNYQPNNQTITIPASSSQHPQFAQLLEHHVSAENCNNYPPGTTIYSVPNTVIPSASALSTVSLPTVASSSSTSSTLLSHNNNKHFQQNSNLPPLTSTFIGDENNQSRPVNVLKYPIEISSASYQTLPISSNLSPPYKS